MYQISKKDFFSGIQKLNNDYPIIIPTQSKEKYYLKYFPTESWEKSHWLYPSIRTPQPLKSFYYPPQKRVATYPGSNNTVDQPVPRVIIGTKACDVNALDIIDRVYRNGEFPDPDYVMNRDQNIIISSDCLDAGEFCACTLLNNKPYLEQGFDLNISNIENDFLLEVGSDKGELLNQKYFHAERKAQKNLVEIRNKQRQSLIEKLSKINQEFKYYRTHQQAIERHLHSDEWQDLSKTCVECGTCTQICPTCHCFLMFDQPKDDVYERLKVWDSCFFAGYSRMAGGLTPRLSLADRFKNRFYHKFDSYVTNFGIEACTGCGRCSEGCMGNIDLRKVLLELEKRVVLKEIIDLV